ncbi:hypothetical protein ATO13_16754 [Stappia sp. 22II-S9-Z10]|nr:hypothetical protein ATO13_16754 [Stappia sp. 22II-S9-Z10]
MKPYLLSLGAGLVVGVVYSLFGVRSPAPPVIALVGLLGILVGEQMLPVARHLLGDRPAAQGLSGSARHIFGRLPTHHEPPSHPHHEDRRA